MSKTLKILSFLAVLALPLACPQMSFAQQPPVPPPGGYMEGRHEGRHEQIEQLRAEEGQLKEEERKLHDREHEVHERLRAIHEQIEQLRH